MHIIVNGTDLDVAEGASILSLLSCIGKPADHVAVECNGEIVDSCDFESRCLRAEDQLEVVHFVGGG